MKNELKIKYLNELINGSLSTKGFDYLIGYTKSIILKHNVKLPNHITIDDIASEAITKAHLYREQYNKEISYEVTWYYTIVLNEIRMTIKKYNVEGIKRIPDNNFIPNTIKNDEGNTISIFDTLNLVDEINFDAVFSSSIEESEIIRLYILEKGFKELYARLYVLPSTEPPNGVYRKFNLVTYEELAEIFDVSRNKINNTIYKQTQSVIKHFRSKDQILTK